MHCSLILLGLSGLAKAACPYMDADHGLKERDTAAIAETNFLTQFTLDDTESFLTTDSGTPIADDLSLKAGERGPTLLEDFIFRQKIQRFDHERVSTSQYF